MSDELGFTGERYVPGTPGEIWYEHWHRYHFATRLVAGLDVLDIACGEGYGSALLSRRAARVIGADLSAAAVAHARERYAAAPNLAFREADCTALPFPSGTFDAIVSFETIEHIAGQAPFVDEMRRVLRPGGIVILSCPNKAEYSDRRGVTNEFHVRELYRDELARLIAPRFAHTMWFGQRPSFYSVIWPDEHASDGEIFEVGESTADTQSDGHARPLYFIVVATASAERLAQIPRTLSVLADRDEWVHHDYEKVFRNLGETAQRVQVLEAEISALQAQHAEAVRERERVEEANAVERLQLRAQLDAQRHETMRRASFRWWLALPLRRLALALSGKSPGE
jgi:SAM-dependent methyltransferase